MFQTLSQALTEKYPNGIPLRDLHSEAIHDYYGINESRQLLRQNEEILEVKKESRIIVYPLRKLFESELTRLQAEMEVLRRSLYNSPNASESAYMTHQLTCIASSIKLLSTHLAAYRDPVEEKAAE